MEQHHNQPPRPAILPEPCCASYPYTPPGPCPRFFRLLPGLMSDLENALFLPQTSSIILVPVSTGDLLDFWSLLDAGSFSLSVSYDFTPLIPTSQTCLFYSQPEHCVSNPAHQFYNKHQVRRNPTWPFYLSTSIPVDVPTLTRELYPRARKQQRLNL